MANIDASFGLRPYKMLGSGPNTNGMSTYKIQSTGTQGVANAFYQGQPVIPLAKVNSYIRIYTINKSI